MPGETVRTPGPSRPLRVAMLWPGRALDPAALSGMPASMARALQARNIEFLHIESRASAPPPLPPFLRRHLRTPARATIHTLRNRVEHLTPQRTKARILAHARTTAAELSRRLADLRDKHPIDLLFGCCISTSLAFLETDLPVVYFSDATPSLINTTYPTYTSRSRGYHDACDELERRALANTTLAAYASAAALHSAIAQYHLPPDRGSEIPMGANITPDRPVTNPHPPPARDRLDLAFIGADPVRKQLDLCVAAAEHLRARGWHATLHVIGPLTRRAAASPAVHPLGRLSLRDPADRKRARDTLADAHFLLLPSTGEAFGIAPCEAAHFAVPSIVSDAGGLPSVVRHNHTGLVLPTTATPDTYADAIESLAADPARYQSHSTAALHRAHTTLNWAAWAEQMHDLFRCALDISRPQPAQRPRPAG